MRVRSFSGFIDTFKSLDVFTKPLEDFQEKTLYGGLVTILCWFTISCLILQECYDYLTTTWKEEIFVDISGGSKLTINLDIIIPSISCNYLELDAVDNSGDQHLHIDYELVKIRLDLDGNHIDVPQPEKIRTQSDTSEINTQKNTTDPQAVTCGSCYGAEDSPDQCCNTCNDIMKAYDKKKWKFVRSQFSQCEAANQDLTNSTVFSEGCEMVGSLDVGRVGGSFHIAPGTSFSLGSIHIHDIQPFSSKMFNTTHTIKRLVFGKDLVHNTFNNFIGLNPLDGHVGLATEGATMFNYYIKLIPTIIEMINGKTHYVYQFSVTTYNKKVNLEKNEGGMPGLFFQYELSPLLVKRTEVSKSLGHLITTILSYISGVYVAALLIDSFVHRIVKWIKKWEI